MSKTFYLGFVISVVAVWFQEGLLLFDPVSLGLYIGGLLTGIGLKEAKK